MFSAIIIDDDIQLCRLLKKCLETEHITADCCFSGKEGLARISGRQYHLVVLDVMLPDINGFDVLAELRKTNPVPVLMLTAKDSEPDKVSGLRLGADDYLTKPFSIVEFTARAQSLIRRYTTLNQLTNVNMQSLKFQQMEINLTDRTVVANGCMAELTGKEFDLLVLLARHPGQVFTKKQIYHQVWKDEYQFDDNNIMAFISKLRRKLECGTDNPYIQTIRGVGYRFRREE